MSFKITFNENIHEQYEKRIWKECEDFSSICVLRNKVCSCDITVNCRGNSFFVIS